MDENEVIFTFLRSHTECCAAAEIEHASVFLPKRGGRKSCGLTRTSTESWHSSPGDVNLFRAPVLGDD